MLFGADSWSLDARVLVRPGRGFQSLAGTRTTPGVQSKFWIALRRPLFLTLVLASGVSLLASSVATVRLVAPTALYWSFVPLVEILALAIVLWRRRGGRMFFLIDTFFAGHAAWTLFLLVIAAAITVSSPRYWWFLITGPAIIGILLVISWSAYVDVCYFRYICGARLPRAIRDVLLHRLVSWALIFWIFAVPDPTPLGVIQEIVRAMAEVLP